jgi:uncharacterized protein YcbK (DUF882 family)
MRYFTRSEFGCKCGCGFAAVDIQLALTLTKLRKHYGKPIIITSGCRCPARNKQAGGTENSFHLKGMAVDFFVQGIDSREVYKLLDEWYPWEYGLYVRPTFVHLDVRSIAWREARATTKEVSGARN